MVSRAASMDATPDPRALEVKQWTERRPELIRANTEGLGKFRLLVDIIHMTVCRSPTIILRLLINMQAYLQKCTQ